MTEFLFVCLIALTSLASSLLLYTKNTNPFLIACVNVKIINYSIIKLFE